VSSERSTEIKVGLFVLFGLLGLVLVVLVLGQKRHVFEARVHVHSIFSSVGGLAAGAPVQIAGVSVGTVSNISFDRTQPQPRIRVDMEVTEQALELLRTDSLARISSQGLLGDKLIDITPGSQLTQPLPRDGLVASSPPADLDHLVAQASRAMEKLQRVADNAARFTDELASESVRRDLRGSLAAIRKLLDATAHGEGLAHAVFYDKRTARELQSIAVGVDNLVSHTDKAIAALQPILRSTDKEGRQLLNNLSRAARGVGQLSEQVRDSRVVANLEVSSENLAQVTGKLRQGEGTLGALLQDPTVYEQLVTILGGVGRSRVLRALVRYAISKDESREAKKLKPAIETGGRRQSKR